MLLPRVDSVELVRAVAQLSTVKVSSRTFLDLISQRIWRSVHTWAQCEACSALGCCHLQAAQSMAAYTGWAPKEFDESALKGTVPDCSRGAATEGPSAERRAENGNNSQPGSLARQQYSLAMQILASSMTVRQVHACFFSCLPSARPLLPSATPWHDRFCPPLPETTWGVNHSRSCSER